MEVWEIAATMVKPLLLDLFFGKNIRNMELIVSRATS